VSASSKEFRRELITGAFLVGISIIAFILIHYQVGTVRAGRPGYLIVVTPKSFPLFAASLMLIISSLNLLFLVRKQKKRLFTDEQYEKMNLKSSLPVFVALLFYVLVLEALGYVISTILLTLFMLYHFQAKKWFIVTIGVFLPPIVYFIFKLLYVPLPKGILGI